MRSTLEAKALAGAWQCPIREGVDTKVEPMQPTFMIMMGMIQNQANDVTLLDMKVRILNVGRIRILWAREISPES